MPFIDTPIVGLFVFEPKIFEDARGYFFESFKLPLSQKKILIPTLFRIIKVNLVMVF